MSAATDSTRTIIVNLIAAGELAEAVTALKRMTGHELDKLTSDLETAAAIARIVNRDRKRRDWEHHLRSPNNETRTR